MLVVPPLTLAVPHHMLPVAPFPFPTLPTFPPLPTLSISSPTLSVPAFNSSSHACCSACCSESHASHVANTAPRVIFDICLTLSANHAPRSTSNICRSNFHASSSASSVASSISSPNQFMTFTFLYVSLFPADCVRSPAAAIPLSIPATPVGAADKRRTSRQDPRGRAGQR